MGTNDYVPTAHPPCREISTFEQLRSCRASVAEEIKARERKFATCCRQAAAVFSWKSMLLSFLRRLRSSL